MDARREETRKKIGESREGGVRKVLKRIAALTTMVRMLVLVKVAACWRRVISSSRGCRHVPGVLLALAVNDMGVWVAGVVGVVVRDMMVEIVDGVDVRC